MDIRGTVEGRASTILTDEAVAFLTDLHRGFNQRRLELLARRAVRQAQIDQGVLPGFLPETSEVRSADWRVAAPPPDLLDRRVEITGPVERKMMINALNSGASTFMGDFEDSYTPTWENVLDGQVNAYDAVRKTIRLEADSGKVYELGDEIATLLIRPRGWHLEEAHLAVDAEPMSGSLVDAGLYLFHNAVELLDRGSGPYFYLPKLESHLEARLWNDVFVFAQDRLGIPQGSIRATVLIETVLAAFEMDEILYELRDHSAGLNAGRWDYIFSIIKKFRNDPSRLLPDRSQITMTVPFMRSYTELLVKTCHRRGAHAMGGMSAFIPNRLDQEVTDRAMEKVRDDKHREAGDGFDGTWVAHPGLVAVARAEFDAILGDRPNQIDRKRPEVVVQAGDLLDTSVEEGRVTLDGVRTNVNVGILYLESWLSGNGAAALYNLMEDAATAEISRSQIWQWVHAGALAADGVPITAELVRTIADEEMLAIARLVGPERFATGCFEQARLIFEDVALSDDFEDFLTIPAYQQLTNEKEPA
ncbi:MAG: malate synthase A [Acidimicrobiia bacterium]|nr:malate synthase A [Acidimicrobiia bacterium]